MSQSKYKSCADVPFQNVAFFLQKCSEATRKKIKHKHLERFRDTFPRHDCFQIYRLLLPHLDTMERPMYQLKEQKLGNLLSKVCGHDPKTSTKAKRVVEYKKLGSKAAGDFAKTAEENLFNDSCIVQEGSPEASKLTVGEVNAYLDTLAESESMEGKEAALQNLVMKTTPTQMKWLVRIILKDCKIGIKEGSILKKYHVEAEDLLNLTSNLAKVCTDLQDVNYRIPRKDVEPGHSIRPQLASMIQSPQQAFKKMNGREFVVEAKFDGERMQLHRRGNDIQFFSRRGREHAELSGYELFTSMVPKQMKWENCILDGEMCVWNKHKKYFEPFGGLRSLVAAVKAKAEPGEVLVIRSSADGGAVLTTDPNYEAPKLYELEVVYIAFDILFADSTSLINLPLKERQQRLREAINPANPDGYPVPGAEFVTTKLIPLLPGTSFDGLGVLSRVGNTEEDIEEMYRHVITEGMEGIVIKAMTEPWQMNNRSDSWLKMKPDYVSKMEIDAVIIGASYGSGHRGGGVAEFLLGLGETPRVANAEPSTFVSFCRVGTGYTMDGLGELREKLKGNLKRVPPKCVRLCGAPRERMDAWVENPLKSIVLEVQGDMRMIMSRQFASTVSLRFPRIKNIRWDKPAVQCSTEKEVLEFAVANKGMHPGANGQDEDGAAQKKRKGATSAGSRQYPAVAAQFRPADVSGVQIETNILLGAPVCFLNYDSKGKDYWHKLVKRLGGEIHMNPIKQYSTTNDPTIRPVVETKYVLAARQDFEKSHKVQAKVKADQFDIIFLDWLEECEEEGQLVEPTPSHYVHIATHHLKDDPWHFDEHGDMPLVDSTSEDIQAIFERHMRHYSIRAARQAADAVQEASTRKAEEIWEEGGDVGDDDLVDVQGDIGRQLSKHSTEPGLSLFQGTKVLFLFVPPKKDLYTHLMPKAHSPPKTAGRQAVVISGGAGAGGDGDGDGTDEVEVQGDDDAGGSEFGLDKAKQVEVLEGVGQWHYEQCEETESADRMCMKTFQLLVESRGGSVVNVPERGLTHVVLWHNNDVTDPVEPSVLLGLLTAMGAAPKRLQGLRRGLEKRLIHLVDAKWVEDSLATASTDHPRIISELHYPPHIKGFKTDVTVDDSSSAFQDLTSREGAEDMDQAPDMMDAQDLAEDGPRPQQLSQQHVVLSQQPGTLSQQPKALSQRDKNQFDDWPWDVFGIASLTGSVTAPSSDDDGMKAAESELKQKGKRKRTAKGKVSGNTQGSAKKPARAKRQTSKPAVRRVRGAGTKLQAPKKAQAGESEFDEDAAGEGELGEGEVQQTATTAEDGLQDERAGEDTEEADGVCNTRRVSRQKRARVGAESAQEGEGQPARGAVRGRRRQIGRETTQGSGEAALQDSLSVDGAKKRQSQRRKIVVVSDAEEDDVNMVGADDEGHRGDVDGASVQLRGEGWNGAEQRETHQGALHATSPRVGAAVTISQPGSTGQEELAQDGKLSQPAEGPVRSLFSRLLDNMAGKQKLSTQINPTTTFVSKPSPTASTIHPYDDSVPTIATKPTPPAPTTSRTPTLSPRPRERDFTLTSAPPKPTPVASTVQPTPTMATATQDDVYATADQASLPSLPTSLPTSLPHTTAPPPAGAVQQHQGEMSSLPRQRQAITDAAQHSVALTRPSSTIQSMFASTLTRAPSIPKVPASLESWPQAGGLPDLKVPGASVATGRNVEENRVQEDCAVTSLRVGAEREAQPRPWGVGASAGAHAGAGISAAIDTAPGVDSGIGAGGGAAIGPVAATDIGVAAGAGASASADAGAGASAGAGAGAGASAGAGVSGATSGSAPGVHQAQNTTGKKKSFRSRALDLLNQQGF